MEIKIFSGFSDVYPEKIDGTSQWFYGQCTTCCEAYEVPGYSGKYEGTRLFLFHIGGEVHEPIPQEKNVFLERPVYSCIQKRFGILRYDFNTGLIQAISYQPVTRETDILAELAMSDAGDLVNVRIAKEPFMLVKHDMVNYAVDFLWPLKRHFLLEENEALDYVEKDTFITSKWAEDPDYREEVIVRDLADGSVRERRNGFLAEMPDGRFWLMTE